MEKQALVKVDGGESFYPRHGEKWMKVFYRDPQKEEELQRAVDWLSVLTLEWFGLLDGQRFSHEVLGRALFRVAKWEGGLIRATNGEMSQRDPDRFAPLLEGCGVEVPVNREEEGER